MAKRLDGSYLAQCLVDDYDQLLKDKVDVFRQSLAGCNHESLPDIEVFESPKQHFRMRANFQMWHDDPNNKTPEGFYYCMFDDKGDKRQPLEIKSFPRATERINELMPLLMQEFHKVPVLFNHLFEVRFLTTKSKEALVVLLYKKPIPEEWQAAAEDMAKKLNIKVIARARKQMKLAGSEEETLCERLQIRGQEFVYFQTEGAFSQPNAYVCEKMISWALSVTDGSSEVDLLELYCGGGTFTAPLCKNFRQVLATEISKASVELAKRAFRANGIDNIQLLRLSSEEFTAFYNGKEQFKRVAGVMLSSYNLQTVFVDPPRAGLDTNTCQLLSLFNNIVYISCNPVTLVRDLKFLGRTHRIERLASFDQFPYTHHLECGVYLTRRETASIDRETNAVDEDNGEITLEQQSKRQKTEEK